MSHKADHSFFAAKKPWSRRKDLILQQYLVPYLPKMATQGKPILLVDGFAGPGHFDDGQPGSPAIIASIVSSEMRRRPERAIYCLFIEPDPVLYKRLNDFAEYRGFVRTRKGRFTDYVDEIVQEAATHQLFLYLDPFTVEGLDWTALARIFAFLQHGTSVEILLNFNVDSFARRGLSALKLALPVPAEELPNPEWERPQPSSIDKLTAIIGGDWWIPILKDRLPYPESVAALIDRFLAQLRVVFNEVCVHEVKECWHHKVPKYVLVFGSRHSHGLLLMNDAMGKSREQLAEESKPKDEGLFETRPEQVVPDKANLTNALLTIAAAPISRREATLVVVRSHFGLYSTGEIHREIGRLLEQEELVSETGRTRIGDDTCVWRKVQ